MRLKQLAAAAIAVLALSPGAGFAALAAKPEVDKLSPTVVRDLHFGDALFYYYQGKDFEAITRLMPTSNGAACRTTMRRPTCCSAACTCRSACTTRPANVSKRC